MQFDGFRVFVESLHGSITLYIDSSAWNRLYDDPQQDRIRKEANAIQVIIKMIQSNKVKLIFSQALQEEMSKYPEIANSALNISNKYIKTTRTVDQRGQQLHQKGLGVYDALHIACAEWGGADVLITTDDRMIKKSKSLGVRVRLENPVDWLKKS